MNDSVTLRAFAKVNLYLDVAGKRPDGYHELVTLFERVDLYDTLTLERTLDRSIEILCDHPDVPVGKENLLHRAAEAFFQANSSSFGVRITLQKRIPVAGGLGGGSSDAATTLLGLQQLSEDPLAGEALLSIARGLGADVPFFLAQTPWALGKGRGDAITPQDIRIQLWHLLVAPGFPIPTKEIYGAFRLPAGQAGLTGGGPDVRLLIRALIDNEVPMACDLLFNALEPTVETLYPTIRRVKSALERCGVARSIVSGSGSTVMGVCGSKEEGVRILEVLKAQQETSWQVFLVPTRA